jgi:hypothetical protein
VHQFAGPVLVVLAGLWLAYLVPHKMRHRQQLLESRADDRYSEALRVVAVTRRTPAADGLRTGRVVRRVTGPAHAGTTGLLTPGTGLPALAGSRTGGETVDRPHATPERVTAAAARRAAQARAARAAAAGRRAAAARRRAALAAFLLVAMIVCWVVVGLAPAAPVLVGLVPTVLLAAVLVAGRHAVVAGRRHDEALAHQIADAEEIVANPRTGATRAVAPDGAAGSAGAAPAAPAAARAAAAVSTAAPAVATPAAARSAAPAASAAKPAAAAARPAAAPATRVTGRAVRPSEAETEVFEAIVADRGEKGASARHASSGQLAAVRRDGTPTAGVEAVVGTEPAAVAAASRSAAVALSAAASSSATAVSSDDESWEPVPVPRPTYTMKPAAPRRQPVPLGEVEASTSVRPASASPVASSSAVSSSAPAVAADEPAAGEVHTPEAPVETSGSIDLNAVLAKRRASGE